MMRRFRPLAISRMRTVSRNRSQPDAWRRPCPPNDSQAPLRHRKLAGTVASFRTWRGSRRSLAQDPAISGGQDLASDSFSSAELLDYHNRAVATASRDVDKAVLHLCHHN